MTEGTRHKQAPTILVVDDEEDLVNLVAYNLKREGYRVITAYDGTSALDTVFAQQPDLIVLDLMLPDRSGIDICKELRCTEGFKKTPIIMLTARSSEHDRVSGFEVGADDYVVKPFSTKELMLRVRALLNRTQERLCESITLGPLTINPTAYSVSVDGTAVNLTRIEFDLLCLFAQHPHRVHSREQILQAVWKNDADEVLDRTVDAHVKRLRSKLTNALGTANTMIETVRGVGYRITESSTIPTATPTR